MIEPHDIKQFGKCLQALLAETDAALSVSFTAHAPGFDCRCGSVSVTIRTAQDEQTSEAVDLHNAIWLVRGKLKAAAEKREKDKAEARGEAA